MENILRQIDETYGARALLEDESEEPLIVAVGHQCKDLRSWGVLDSVLRMVQTPKDLYAQPERFLSYFVNPAPPTGEIKRSSESVSFVLPMSETRFPLVTSYLRAALEALPTYIAKPMASVGWDNNRVIISWSEGQASLFGERDSSDLSLNPELVRNILHNLETSQKELEETKRKLIAKDLEIESLRTSVRLAAPMPGGAATGPAQNVANVLHELYRLGDYIARGQQLITLLIGQGRQTQQVREAMRRVDWDFVVQEGPKTVRKAVAELQQLQQSQLQPTSAERADNERNHQLPC